MVQVAKNILSIKPYKPGKPISEVKRELGLTTITKLASNENPLGPSPKVIETIKQVASQINIYPDGSAYELKNAIIKYHKNKNQTVTQNQIVVGNGSNDVIEIAIRTLVGKDEELVVSKQAFIVYELISKASNINYKTVPLKQDFSFDIDAYINAFTEKTKLVCLVNPNNPTGTYFSKQEFEKLLKALPKNAIVLIDEAYIDFVDKEDYPDSLNYRKNYPNMISCRTFSKAFGMSGLRLGYAITSEEIADYMNRVREPFNTNIIAQTAGITALEDEEYLKKGVLLNNTQREIYYKEFEKMGLEYVPSQGNFILVKVGETEDSGMKAYNFLLKNGVIVRPMNGYGFPKHIRISIGLEEENQKCISILKQFLVSE
jgi:histidinol-phosphate aminotransferase